MKVSVDLSKCNGYANCVDQADDIFDLDDKGHAVVLVTSPDKDRAAAVWQAARLCPVRAILVSD